MHKCRVSLLACQVCSMGLNEMKEKQEGLGKCFPWAWAEWVGRVWMHSWVGRSMLTEGVCALSLNVCMFHTCRFNQQTNPLKTAKQNSKNPCICTGHGQTSWYSVNKYAMRILYHLLSIRNLEMT